MPSGTWDGGENRVWLRSPAPLGAGSCPTSQRWPGGVTCTFSPQWCSSTQPRGDSPWTRHIRGAGWRWPLAQRAVGRTASRRGSEATAVCSRGWGQWPQGSWCRRWLPVSWGRTEAPRKRRCTAAGVQPHLLSMTGQRTWSWPPAGALDMAGGDIPAWGSIILHLTRAGPWWTGGDYCASPAGQGMAWMRLSLEEALPEHQ